MVKSTKRNYHKKKKGGRKTRQKGGYVYSSRGPFDSINSFYARNTAPPPIMQDLYKLAREGNKLLPGSPGKTYNEIVDSNLGTQQTMPIMRDPFHILTGEIGTNHHHGPFSHTQRESAFEGAELEGDYEESSALGEMITKRAEQDRGMEKTAEQTQEDKIKAIEFNQAFEDQMKTLQGKRSDAETGFITQIGDSVNFGESPNVFGSPKRSVDSQGNKIGPQKTQYRDTGATDLISGIDDANKQFVAKDVGGVGVTDQSLKRYGAAMEDYNQGKVGLGVDETGKRVTTSGAAGTNPVGYTSGDGIYSNAERLARFQEAQGPNGQNGGRKRKTRKNKKRKHKRSKRRRPRRKTKKH